MIHTSQVSDDVTIALNRLEQELRISGMSPRTIKSYTSILKEYFKWKGNGSIKLDEESIRKFLLHKEELGCIATTRNLVLNAIKYFYRNIEGIKTPISIRSAKESKKLPIIFSREEIKFLLNCTENLKHRLLIATAYGAGLRISEVLDLCVQDINLEEKTIHIKQSKGKKDRITVFPESICEEMKAFIFGRYGHELVFPSERGGKLTTSSARLILLHAMEKAGIEKKATFHSLRHSFAAHLLEDGVDIRYIQELLGHYRIETTQRYTHITNPQIKNIKSPL